MRNPDALYQIACCLRSSAAKVLEDHDLRVPERGGITHKGPDYECENCESLWVWMEDTLPAITLTDDGKCSDPKQRVFVVELALPVCTEALTPCGEQSMVCETDENGCAIADPKIGDGKCLAGERPTVLQETAYIWRARYVLESELACAAQCCIEDCACLRCNRAELLSVSEETQGGCSFLTFRIGLTW